MAQGFPETLRIILEPVAPLLDDPAVTSIFINGPDEVWVERDGAMERVELKGRLTEGILIDAVRAAARLAGGGLSGEATRLEARFGNGARMSAVLPPAALKGPCLVLRPADPTKMSMGDLVASGTLTPKARRFLEAAVRTHRSIVVCGGRGSGRSALLGALAGLAPRSHRVVVLEETPELDLVAEHVVPLSAEKAGDVEELVDALNILRPDLIVIGDLLGSETLPALRLMTGGVCVLTCVHGASPLDALIRLEALAYLAGGDLTPAAVRGIVAAAVDLVVELVRLDDGSRRVVQIAEPVPIGVDGALRARTIMHSSRSTASEGLEMIGVEPSFAEELRSAGFVDLSPEFFGVQPGAPRHPEVAPVVGISGSVATESMAVESTAPEPTPAPQPLPTPSPISTTSRGDEPPPPPPGLRNVRTDPGARAAAQRRDDEEPDPAGGPDARPEEGISESEDSVRAGRLPPAEEPADEARRERAKTHMLTAEELEEMSVEEDGPDPSDTYVSMEEEPGVTIGGAAVYAKPERPYEVDGSTDRYQDGVGPEPAGGTQPGVHPAEGQAKPSGTQAQPAAPVETLSPRPRRRQAKTLAVEAPHLKRKTPAPGAEDFRDSESSEYIRSSGGAQAEWGPGEGPAPARFESTPSGSERPAGWDAEAQRELDEDRRRREAPKKKPPRPTRSVEIDFDEPSKESVTEDTTPGARIPKEFIED